MYVDFDYDCLESVDRHIADNGTCYFSKEPDDHCRMSGKGLYFSNALMITPPGHPFFDCVIKHLQSATFVYTGNKMRDVLRSTGPIMLTSLYETFKDKHTIDFFLPELVSPWTKNEVQSLQ